MNLLSLPGNSVNPHFPQYQFYKNHEKFTYLKITEKDCNYLFFCSCTFNMSYKSLSFLTALSCHGHVNFSTPTFGNIKLIETGIYLIVDSKFNKKMATRISTCIINPLKLPPRQIHI